ncbi:MAG: XdhC family protein [Oleiphilaceae bacterium]|nr:XdhC family protein [Oleiphilaceae bacterium]
MSEATESDNGQGAFPQSRDRALQLLATLCGWLEQGQKAWLVTVINSYHHSITPPGSLVAVNEQGQWLGLAGPPERALVEQALEQERQGEVPVQPRWLEALWDNGEREDEGLPYAGLIRLLLEPLDGDDGDHIRQLRDALEQRKPATRRVIVATAQRQLLERSIPNLLESDPSVLLHTLLPVCHVLLLGATEISRQVARLACQSDFAVTVCEPRPALASAWQQRPEPGVALQCGPPEELVAGDFQDYCCAILALADDPRVDDPGLVAAMDTPAFYVGALGSDKAHGRRKDRLYKLGVPSHWIGTIHAPIGFIIGSRTPGEVAIAILAQLIAERHRRLHRNSRL